jgi:transcriptional regulator
VADRAELVAAVEESAAALAGPVLTERQALAYLLREVMDADREVAAEAMDSTPSNVDNLQRRAVEKVTEAERVVEALEALQSDSESTSEE